MAEMTPDKIKEILVIDEEKLYAELLTRVSKHVALSKEGKILLKLGKYRDKDRVVLYLLGKYYSHKAKMVDTEVASNTEIATGTGLKMPSVNARLNDLRKEGFVDSPKPNYNKVVFGRALSILEYVEKHAGKHNLKGDEEKDESSENSD